MKAIGSALARLFARGDAGIGVPAMDGVLKPNGRLEAAERLLPLPGIDALGDLDGQLLASAGRQLHVIATHSGGRTVESFEEPLTFVATGSGGQAAIGLQGRGIRIGRPGAWSDCPVPDGLAACMTAAAFLPDGRLAVCVGSRQHPVTAWKRDLMSRGRSGCVVALDPRGGRIDPLAEGLAFPNGVAALDGSRLAVAESWRHRILALPSGGGGRPEVLLDDLPAYPSRLAPASGGGHWLALFAPRRQLFELILREDGYRREMMETIDPAEWIGPTLEPSTAPDHPLQQGSVRQMGLLKPWAPSSSYGLVLRCDAAMRPQESWHSRADGSLHGVTAVCETGDGVFAAAQGAGMLLRLAGPADGRGGTA